MAGTQETGEYVGGLSTRLSRVGYRYLQNGYYRIKVEPKPGGQSITSEAEHLFPSGYAPLLRHFLTVFARRLPLKELRASLREVGRTAAKEYLDQVKSKTRGQRTKFALSVLKALGGDVTVEESEGKRFIFGNGCPLSAATAHHSEACLTVEALLSEIIGVPVKERCHHDEAPRCRFEIS